MRILAIDPFHTGSHRDFALGIDRHSRHTWHWITGTGVHWKWRMRSFPMVAACEIDRLNDAESFDAVFCTDMLDLPALLGLIRWSPIARLPTVIYFHENQWAYPVRTEATADHHYGYTNLLSASVADRVVFNSDHNRKTFCDGSRSFLSRMPDSKSQHDLDLIEAKSHVISPGFEPTVISSDQTTPPCNQSPQTPREQTTDGNDDEEVITLGWVSRWEHDKRPDRLLDLLTRLKTSGLPFQLVLLGPRQSVMPEAHRQVVAKFRDAIDYDDFAEPRSDYLHWLSQIDVVISTADHEFFGVAMCEAINAGAVPVVPNGLAYDEYVPDGLRYKTVEEAANVIFGLSNGESRAELSLNCRRRVREFRRPAEVSRLDDVFDRISDS